MEGHDSARPRLGTAQALLGYLNFSNGKPDPRFQKQLDEAFTHFVARGEAEPAVALFHWLREELQSLRSADAAAFRDSAQVEAVLALTADALLPTYRRHHADLLGHQTERELWQPFFLARAFEAVLEQSGPWNEAERIVAGAMNRLNDFTGYRPVAILETRPRGEPYEHEKVRPIPLFLRGAGVASGPYHGLVRRALDLLERTDADLLNDAGFDPKLLDELALDPRAYDQNHPVNRRSNYIFGEWDPAHLDNQGRYRRFVVRQVTLDGLLDRVRHPGELDAEELLFEAAAVLAGTVLMASGVSGSGPGAHDSSASLTSLMPRIAAYRDLFYRRVLEKLGPSGPHGQRLLAEAETTRQPFGGARQHLNIYLARHRAAQMQQRSLAVIYADMGYAEASRREAGRIAAVSVRLLSELLGRMSTGHLHLDRGELDAATALLPSLDDLLHRGIGCGAFVDPWNILGFQGLFPLSSAREDAVRDPRIPELIHLLEHLFGFGSRVLSEAGAAGRRDLFPAVTAWIRTLATWWDRFATVEVAEVRRIHGGEVLASAEHVADALARWRERGEAAGDLAFWREHLEGFRTPKAFAQVIHALLEKKDYRAAMALLMNWLSQAEQTPLEDGQFSFHALALRWMLSATLPRLQQPESPSVWPLVRRFFDHLEANAEEYWQPPTFAVTDEREEEEEDLYGAAYEDVTYHDSADDDEEGSVAGGGLPPPGSDFPLESQADDLEQRLRFLTTLAQLWLAAARHDPHATVTPNGERAEVLAEWLGEARRKQQRLLELLDALNDCRVPQPSGSPESLLEYDRRRLRREQVLETAINTALAMSLAVGALHGAIGEQTLETTESEPRPPWEAYAIELEQALVRGDAVRARTILPQFLEPFRREPLLYIALADGGQPRFILRARTAQAILRALVGTLPRLGLLRETYHLLRTARFMEQAHAVPGVGVSQFNQLFQGAFQSSIESVVRSSDDWDEADDDAALVALLERFILPFLTMWNEDCRKLRLSVLETIRGEEEWQSIKGFVRRYGADLFHPRSLTPGNLRGVLHRGVEAYLDHLVQEPDPLHPLRLVEDLEAGTISRTQAARAVQVVMQAVLENYEEYKDYQLTTTQANYGQNIHLLLDFLRLKAAYARSAWVFRPWVLVHEVLLTADRDGAARRWEATCVRMTEELANSHEAELARLQKSHAMRMTTVADRVAERFVKPLALDRLCAHVEPAMEEAREGPGGPAFVRLETELQALAATPAGVGLDVPEWLRRLAMEVQAVRAARATSEQFGESLFEMPHRSLRRAELEEQMSNWEQPLETPDE